MSAPLSRSERDGAPLSAAERRITPDHTSAWWQPQTRGEGPTLAEVSAAELYIREQAMEQGMLQSGGFREWLDDHPEHANAVALAAMWALDRDWRPDDLQRLGVEIARLREAWLSWSVDHADDAEWLAAHEATR